MKGRVAVLREYFKPFELEEFEVPTPEPGAVIVRISMAGLCGSDLHTWRGDHGSNRPIPPTGMLLGHEGTGTVAALGQGVTADFMGSPLKEGDRVVFSAINGCGRCLYCLNGEQNLCSSGGLINGRWPAGQAPYFANTYSDYVYLRPSHPVFRVPDEVADEDVVAINCAMGTVLQGLQAAGTREGHRVVVQGAGGLGLYAIAFARDIGASQIIAIDGQAARLDLARKFGAETIDINEYTSAEERVARLMSLTGNQGADVILELAGFGELVQEGINMLGRNGTFVEIGNLMRGRIATIEPSSLLRGKRVVGSVMYRPSILPTILDFLVRNHTELPIGKVISHKFDLASINDAFAESEWSGRTTPVIRSALVP